MIWEYSKQDFNYIGLQHFTKNAKILSCHTFCSEKNAELTGAL